MDFGSATQALSERTRELEFQLKQKDVELEDRGRLLFKTKNAIEALQMELGRAREEEKHTRETVQRAYDEQTSKLSQLEAQLQNCEFDLGQKNKQVLEMQRNNSALEGRITQLLGELDRARVSREDVERTLAERTSEDLEKAAQIVALQKALQQSSLDLEAESNKVDRCKRALDEKDALIKEFVEASRRLEHERASLENDMEKLKQKAAVDADSATHREKQLQMRLMDMEEEIKKVIQRARASENSLKKDVERRVEQITERLRDMADKETVREGKLRELTVQLNTAKDNADAEANRRLDVERTLAEASSLFKRELFAKNEELRELQKEVALLREYQRENVEHMARDIHDVKALVSAPQDLRVRSPLASNALADYVSENPATSVNDVERELRAIRTARESYQTAMLSAEEEKKGLLAQISSRLDRNSLLSRDDDRSHGRALEQWHAELTNRLGKATESLENISRDL